MKYTVIIEQAVPEAAQGELQRLLAERFSLNEEQARKLASRRGGRLMKPTGRERAAVLLEIFLEVGASVRVEEVPESGAPAPSSAPAGLPLSGAAERDLRATEFGHSDAAPTPAPAPQLHTDWDAPMQSNAALLNDVASASAAPSATLNEPTTDLSFASLSSSQDAMFAPSESSDVWSDFTGALTAGGSASAPAASVATGRPSGAAEGRGAVESSDLMLQSALESEQLAKVRQPLARQLTNAAVVPLALFTALTLMALTLGLNASQRTLISHNATAVASAVGSVLNTTDQNTVQRQLVGLLSGDAVGFVQIFFPDGTSFFRSQDSQADNVLGERLNTWSQGHPEGGIFVQTQTPAQLYAAQIKRLQDAGVSGTDQLAALQAAAKDPRNQAIANRNFQVEQVGVYAGENGAREVRTVNAASGAQPLYRVAVGVPLDAARNQVRNTLLTLLGLGLLTLLLSAWLARNAAQRVVQPLERLVKAADAISMGDLRQSVRPENNDEIGDLAQALERMRLSLDAAMERLRRRRAR